MNPELEEQQKLVCELKDQLQSMEKEEKELTEKVRILETKLVVQDLQDKIKVKSEAINQLRSKATELEEKLRSKRATPVQEQIQPAPLKEETPRQFF
jgi:predicted nucleotidyltransferase component of viral defense system